MDVVGSVLLGEQPAQAEPAAAAVVAGGGALLAGRGAAAAARDGAARGVDLVEERVRLQQLVLPEDEAADEVAEALLLLGRRRRLPAPHGGRHGEHGPLRPPPTRGRRRRRCHGRHGAAEPHRRHATSFVGAAR
jgi:hypothetical protein